MMDAFSVPAIACGGDGPIAHDIQAFTGGRPFSTEIDNTFQEAGAVSRNVVATFKTAAAVSQETGATSKETGTLSMNAAVAFKKVAALSRDTGGAFRETRPVSRETRSISQETVAVSWESVTRVGLPQPCHGGYSGTMRFRSKMDVIVGQRNGRLAESSVAR
jgi:hypothetical protein